MSQAVPMITGVRNLLYKDPVLYDLAYPDDDEALAEKCLRRLSCVASSNIDSVLDLGCGTGRVLAGLAARCAVVAGVDINPIMVEAASQRCPNVPILATDLRSARLGRTFDAIIMLGNHFK